MRNNAAERCIKCGMRKVSLVGIHPAADYARNEVPTRAFQFAIRIDSIHCANRFESIRFVKNRPFDSLVVM